MNLAKVVRRVFALLGSCVFLLPLSACGSANAGGRTTLSFLSWYNEQTMKPFIDEFERRNPDISVDFSFSPPTPEYIQTLQTRLVGNQAPDVFIITSENKADLIKNHYVRDLTDEPFMKDIDKTNKDFVSQSSRVYGMSLSSWASGIVYNKDLLAKVGAKDVPQDWDGFLDLCARLKNVGVTPYLETISEAPSRITDGFQGSLYESRGVDVGHLVDKMPQTPGQDQKEATEAWLKLYERGLVSRNVVGMSADDMKSEFTNGRVAMICTGPWDFPAFSESGIHWGLGAMPVLRKGMTNYAQGSPSPGYAIYSGLSGDKLKAAQKFLTFLSSKWSLEQFSRNGDAITVKGFSTQVIPQYRWIYEHNVRTGKYFLVTNFFVKPDVLSTELKAETQRLLMGSEDVDGWARNVDAKMAAVQ
ncbi:family 1 extracellular solute-binding protein [Bifidobacterium actinocoloniiforme DSM 22766]|uniref:Family 1 extracellular solute-binding protein n=1 Tax=Bifidobacterium actinocoloniiforme DSM 22766 TaxID=1437605 RepID=A0A086YYE7_9BIFI|nr:extracellular solute-binding protein [Bifidobacterium actinocoloniiforme]AKV55850.1 ABC transporter substrate-binding protein [Bifidobacterium actinocoloniiforme DSM 22766]KFI39297.1 family 1 extracellular solute-binding protein [Bifidobacterium actinocoloniiforme DSM 22766]